MTSVTLVEPQAAADLDTFLGRAQQVQDGAARLVAADGVLGVYVPVLFPSGLLDDSATVLGLRAFAIVSPADGDAESVDAQPADVVVPIASLRARVASALRDGVIGLPAPVYSVTWAGVAPPRAGWQPLGQEISTALLSEVAEQGIRDVAAALPDSPGEELVRQVRSLTWGQRIAGFDHLPRGAALAAETLGFLPPASSVDEGGAVEVGELFEVGPWTRLSLARGHVVVKRRAWSLAG